MGRFMREFTAEGEDEEESISLTSKLNSEGGLRKRKVKGLGVDEGVLERDTLQGGRPQAKHVGESMGWVYTGEGWSDKRRRLKVRGLRFLRYTSPPPVLLREKGVVK